MKLVVCHSSSMSFISCGDPSPARIGITPGNRLLFPVLDVLQHFIAELHEFGRPGNIDVLGSANGDRLDALVSHDGADSAAAGAGSALLDGGKIDPVFAGQTDGGHLGFGSFNSCRMSSAVSLEPLPRRWEASRISTLSLLIHR